MTMNALEIADQLTHGSHQWGFALPLINESAAMLHRQHEAILKLRAALGGVMKLNNGEPEFVHAFKVLNETMEIAK